MNKCANLNAKCKGTAADAFQSEAALLLTPFACVLRLRPGTDDLHAAIQHKIGCTEQNVDKLANKFFQNETFCWHVAQLHQQQQQYTQLFKGVTPHLPENMFS